MIIRLIIAVKIGIMEIMNNKVRSLLSIFAVSIGVFTFLFVFSAINYSKDVIKKATALGAENSFTLRVRNWNHTRKLRLTVDNLFELQRKYPEIKTIYPVSSDISIGAFMDSKIYKVILKGILPEWRNIDWVYTDFQGRFINWDDVLQRRRVAVFIYDPYTNKNTTGYDANSRYGFRGDDDMPDMKWEMHNKYMLGKKIKIRGETFTIVGTMRALPYKDDHRFEIKTHDVLLPFTAVNDLFWHDRFVEEIFVETYKEADITPVQQKITNYLRIRLGDRKANFHITTFKEKAENRFAGMRKNLMLISVLGLIAMVSGGIGIMNVVLATIYARTKEIGTRRALGATKTDIFVQFSFESIVLSLFGAALGYGIYFFAADYLSRLLSMQTKLDWVSVALAFAIAALTGFLFSLYPSIKAANMNPVDALKVE